jgi:hypothetical protein
MARQCETAELPRLISEAPSRWQRPPGQSHEVVNALYQICNSDPLAAITEGRVVLQRSNSEGKNA